MSEFGGEIWGQMVEHATSVTGMIVGGVAIGLGIVGKLAHSAWRKMRGYGKSHTKSHWDKSASRGQHNRPRDGGWNGKM